MAILKKIFRVSNIGIFIFFALNISLILWICSFFGKHITLWVMFIYFSAVLVSLTPIGEIFLCALADAKKIKRSDMLLKIIPLLEIVYERAKKQTPDIVKKVHLKIIYGQEANAFVIGCRTICVTEGIFDLPDEAIMGLLAHEIGHLANRHMEIQLLIGGGNIFITGFIILLKMISFIIVGVSALVTLRSRSCLQGCLAALAGALSVFMVWAWTKFCLLFLMWSRRQNEYVADRYAFEIGFGYQLAAVLDSAILEMPPNRFICSLYATHPNVHDRIRKLQQMGVRYTRY